MNSQIKSKQGLKRLSWEWAAWSALCVFSLIRGYKLLNTTWDPIYAMGWLMISAGLLLYQLIVLRRNLSANVSHKGKLYSGLGLANWITLLRGAMIAFMAGFLSGPLPIGWLGWLPGILYFCATLLDYLDGYAARMTGRQSVLGERLEAALDGLGVLVGTLLAIHYGQAPVWYLAVGLARYLFLFTSWLRFKQGKAIYPLPTSTIRRPLAGVQMQFIAIILLPVFRPPATLLAASLFMTPFLIGFAWDWLYVSGHPILFKTHHSASPVQRLISAWTPFILRVLLSAFLLIFVFQQEAYVNTYILWAGCMVIVFCLIMGAAGRTAALAAMLYSGILMQSHPLSWIPGIILVLSSVVFFIGTGALSYWKPEDRLIFHYAGEKDE